MRLHAPRTVALVVGQLQLGGAEGQLYELAVRLDRSRYRPFVVCLSEVTDPYASLLREQGVDVEVLPRRGHHDLVRAGRLGRLLARRRTDLAHSFLIAANAYTFAACRLAGLGVWSRPPFIASSRTCIPPASGWEKLVHRRAFRAAAAVIANSRRVMEFTRDLYGLPESRLRIIHNGVDLGAHVSESDPGRDGGILRAAARDALGVPGEALLVGTLGRLSQEKNLPLFLALAARLARPGMPAAAEAAVPWSFVIVGDGPVMPQLKQEAARLGLSGCVHFAGARRDAPRLLPALDIFVLTSDTEGLPNAVMEAMAAGVPVVSTRVGGTDEVIAEGRTGFLVPRGDVEALADRVARLAIDEDLRRLLGYQGRARIAADFSVGAMVSRTMEIYDEVRG